MIRIYNKFDNKLKWIYLHMIWRQILFKLIEQTFKNFLVFSMEWETFNLKNPPELGWDVAYPSQAYGNIVSFSICLLARCMIAHNVHHMKKICFCITVS